MENDTRKRGSSSISRNLSIGYYYQRRSSEGVPFKWEMQPGTPINTQPGRSFLRSVLLLRCSASASPSHPSPSKSQKHSVFPAKCWGKRTRGAAECSNRVSPDLVRI
ncbi:hypothetical protein Bca4012_093491 [Brassica carinata]